MPMIYCILQFKSKKTCTRHDWTGRGSGVWTCHSELAPQILGEKLCRDRSSDLYIPALLVFIIHSSDFHWLYKFVLSLATDACFPYSTSSAARAVTFDHCHSDRWEMEPQRSFDWHFPDDYECWTFPKCFSVIWVSSFENSLFRSVPQFGIGLFAFVCLFVLCFAI